LETGGIKEIVEKFFTDNAMENCFFVDAKGSGKKLEVFVDKDGGISYDVCRLLSRHLESIFDEDKRYGESYILDVSSPGVGSPLKLSRQYRNNVGRTIAVKTAEAKLEGILKEADEDGCTIEYTLETKVDGKKKKEIINHKLNYVDIIEAKIKISF